MKTERVKPQNDKAKGEEGDQGPSRPDDILPVASVDGRVHALALSLHLHKIN